MPVTVEDVEKVFRFASMFYHNPALFYDVLGFRFRVLGVENFGLITKDKGKLAYVQATEYVGVVALSELWKLILPNNVYSIIVEAYYAVDDCDDLEYCLRIRTTLKPLWYRVVSVAEGDLEEAGEGEAEEE
jgi:hypothetical protein